jgi:sarcosine oxidase subunit alpha
MPGSWAVGKKKPDFVGIRGMKRPGSGGRAATACRPDDEGRKTVLEEGAQIVADPNQSHSDDDDRLGFSSYWSENCGRPIAMALVEGGRNRMGETLYVPMPDRTIEVEVSDTVFIDKEGVRLNG